MTYCTQLKLEREVIMAQVEVIKANLNKKEEENVNFKSKQVCAYCRVSTDS